MTTMHKTRGPCHILASGGSGRSKGRYQRLFRSFARILFTWKRRISHTEFRMASDLTEVTIQDIYAALVDDVSRNEMIANDIVPAIESGRCPLLLTGRTEHLQHFAAKLEGVRSEER